jgi:hypothetical protein
LLKLDVEEDRERSRHAIAHRSSYQLTEIGSMLFPSLHALVPVGEKLRLPMSRP